jgi:hypothetical protein
MEIEEARKFLDGELLAITLEYSVSSETQKKRLEQKFAALNVAIGAIDTQIPKKIACIDNTEHGFTGLIASCPCCGNDELYAVQDYCDFCGQALDWSVEND